MHNRGVARDCRGAENDTREVGNRTHYCSVHNRGGVCIRQGAEIGTNRGAVHALQCCLLKRGAVCIRRGAEIDTNEVRNLLHRNDTAREETNESLCAHSTSILGEKHHRMKDE